MVQSTQKLGGGEDSLLAEKSVETKAPGGTATAALGGNGFRPAGQARYTMDENTGGEGTVRAGASVTATVGQGISASAYAQYDLTKGDTQVRLGLSADYNKASGHSLSVGGRVDHNTGMAAGPVKDISVYASGVASTDSKKSGVEAGVCGTANILGHNVTGCAGANSSRGFVIGLGTSF